MTPDLVTLAGGAALNLAVALVIVRFIYARTTQEKNYIFSFLALNTVIFFVLGLLTSVELSIGVGFGLFAIFSVLRYRTEETRDGLPPGEGAFLPCSFWLVDNLMLQGRREEAQALFERLLALRNDVGLLAEEYDPRAQRQLGNFPQAFSHLALIGTALNLSPAEAKPVTQRPAGRCDP